MANRLDYQQSMERRLQDLDFLIRSVRTKISDGLDTETKALLSGELETIEERRDEVRERLEALSTEPDATWPEAQAEIDQEWDALVQDFEERLGGFHQI